MREELGEVVSGKGGDRGVLKVKGLLSGRAAHGRGKFKGKGKSEEGEVV